MRVKGRGLVPPSLSPPAAATETALSQPRGGPVAIAASSGAAPGGHPAPAAAKSPGSRVDPQGPG